MDFEGMTTEQIEDLLCHGQCYPAAIAMNEILTWPIGGLMAEYKGRNWMPHLIHSYLISPDGRAFDAGGFREMCEIHDHFITPEREKDCRNIEFVQFDDAEVFRAALRPLYEGGEVEEGTRTDYDDFLDEHLPSIRWAVNERLDVVSRSREGEFAGMSH